MGRAAHHRSRRAVPVPITDDDLVARLRTQRGPEVDGLERALRSPSPVSIRVNTTKWSGPAAARIPWCATGHYLEERPSFTFDPLFHAGAYYVQEASSMALEQAVKASGLGGERIVALDLCAAPGGKSTHLRSLLHPDALLVSNEIEPKRQRILVENLWKWGAANTVVSGAAPEKLARLPEFFDLVVVDAPCSGEGMFRKDGFARTQWSEGLVRQCNTTQSHILQHAWDGLKPGGLLIYSTCTWETSENETQVAQLLAKGGRCVPIPSDPAWGMIRSTREGVDALRCYPHRLRGEGFFIALVQKNGDRVPSPSYAVDPDRSHAGGGLEWLRPTHRWIVMDHGEERFAVDGTWSRMVERLHGLLPVLSSGTPLGERKADSWRPHAALALSQDLDRTAFQQVALNHDQAIAYLRGNSILASQAQGAALAMYQGIPIGWLQGAGNRWNNRWPSSWRIRVQQPGAPFVSWKRNTDSP